MKSSLRIEAIGSIDEANAFLGILKTVYVEDIQRIQQDLFDIGADLCLPDSEARKLTLHEKQVAWLETRLDTLNATLPPLTSFILPNSLHHIARTIVRRAERTAVTLDQEEAINPSIIVYLNRLSDYLFVLSRAENQTQEALWEPGKNQ